jgi:hypothetical protein
MLNISRRRIGNTVEPSSSQPTGLPLAEVIVKRNRLRRIFPQVAGGLVLRTLPDFFAAAPVVRYIPGLTRVPQPHNDANTMARGVS